MLFEKGADFTVANERGYGCAPLSSVSMRVYPELVNLLLDYGADIGVKDVDGETPLHLACAFGHLKVVKLLVDQGADINALNNNERIQLICASTQGHAEVVELLLENGADIDNPEIRARTPFLFTLIEKHTEVARLLLEAGANINTPDEDGYMSLIVGSMQGHMEMTELLLEKGADLSTSAEYGWTPLHYVSGKGHDNVVKLLLEKGADACVTDNRGQSPLILASANDHAGVVRQLFEGGGLVEKWICINIRESGWDALISASYHGSLEVARLLLTVPEVDPNRKDVNDRTSLFFAAARDHSELVHLLLSSDAMLHVKDRNGSTPLFAAVRNGHDETAKMLLRLGEPSIELEDGIGRLFLWWATRSGNVNVTQLGCGVLQSLGLEVPSSYSEMQHIPKLPAGQDISWCDVCTRYVPKESSFNECRICEEGGFCICMDCSEIGAKFDDSSHE